MQRRIYFLMLIAVLLGGSVLVRLFSLQALQYSYYRSLAQDQHQIYQTLFPQRGEIFLQDLSLSRRDGQDHYYPLAVNKEFQQVYIIPKDVPGDERESLADQLSGLLDMNRDVILQRADKPGDPYEPLQHKIGEEIASQVAQIDIAGLGLAPEMWRFYPNDMLASHLSGFVGISMQGEHIGQYGLEDYYERKLKGQSGFLSGGKDISGYGIPTLVDKLEPAQDGADLVLAIDQNIQFKAEKELREAAEKWKAEKGTIIVMNPQTGAILAMANWPAFDPNEYSAVEDIDIFLNSAIQEVYEPGSVFKPITMAAGLESGHIGPMTVYQDKGQIWIGDNVVRNVDDKVYGEQTMTQALEKSLNTGAVYVQQTVGPKLFREYIQRFNFDKPTGIDLAGETHGSILNLFSNQDIDLATISFGQGVTVTPLSLIQALAAVANKGKMMKPYVVHKTVQADGAESVTEPEVVGEVMSSQTAGELTKMMVSVVDNGCGTLAQVDRYTVAGKTGTAQIPDFEKGGYLEDDTIHTFVGFAPAFDAQFIILVKLDKPQGIRFAAASVGPVFKKMAQYLFNYLEIPPR